MTAVYPTIEDWDAWVDSLTPAPAAIGDSGIFIRALMLPWSVIDQDLLTLTAGYVDLDTAPMWVLEIAGAQVNEPPGGLGVTEYRRIIAGRRLSIGSAATSADVYAVILALAGASQGRIRALPPASTAMYAPSAFTPSVPYLQRAGRVLRDAVDKGGEHEAILYVTSTLRFGEVITTTSTLGYPLAM